MTSRTASSPPRAKSAHRPPRDSTHRHQRRRGPRDPRRARLRRDARHGRCRPESRRAGEGRCEVSIYIDKSSRVLIQGITGRDGSFHARQMREYGTAVVAGVTPGKGGQKFDGEVPIFNTVADAVEETKANVSVIYVPPPFAADAMMEAAAAGVKLIVCITEGVPVLDMTRVYPFVKEHGARLIGPNCPGLITPGESKVGIIPGGCLLYTSP